MATEKVRNREPRTVYLGPDVELKLVRTAAELAGVKVSEWCRGALVNEARRTIAKATRVDDE